MSKMECFDVWGNETTKFNKLEGVNKTNGE